MKKFGSWSEQASTKFRTSGDNKEVTITPSSTLAGASLSLTIPSVSGTTDDIVLNTSTATLTNKTLTAPVISTITNTGTLTLPTSTDTLVGRATTDTLTNKSIDGDTNTISDLALTTLKTTANLNVFLQRDGSGIVVDSAKSVPTGDVIGTSDTQTLTNKTIDSDLNTITNIVNADIKASAAIVYSKLSLSDSIVNADINSAAAIAYSKLALSNSIVNADINASAAIAYSKLNLASSIVNADIAAAAAIARTKLADGTADHVLINNGTGVMSSEAQLAITRGGTGAATATAAFDNLAPTTTKGDLVAHNGTDNIRVAVGTDGQVLTANSANASGLGWSSPLVNPMDSEGDLIVGGVAGAATKLDSGTANYLLQANGAAAPSWTLIDNDNIDAAAAIDGTKISPAFGTQNVTATGEFTFTKNQNATSTWLLQNTDNTNQSSRALIRLTGGTVLGEFNSIATSGLFVGTNSAHSLNLVTNGNSRAVINTNGNFAITAISGADPLNATSNNNSQRYIVMTNTDSGGNAQAGIRLISDAGSAYIAKNSIARATGAAEALVVTNETGGVYMAPGATAWSAISDMRFKTKVADLTGVLDKVKDVTIFTYKLNDTVDDDGNVIAARDTTELGVSAQEFLQSFPEVVGGTVETQLGIAYDRIGPIALQAVKELLDKVEALEARIAALEGV